MSEKLEQKPPKSEDEITNQITRIAKKLVDRANAGPYGSSEKGTVSISEPNPNGDGRRVTRIEAEKFRGSRGATNISETVTNDVADIGTNVSVVPGVGTSAQAFGRAGDKNVYKTLSGERQQKAFETVPAQLARVRGGIAQREIEQAQFDEERRGAKAA